MEDELYYIRQKNSLLAEMHSYFKPLRKQLEERYTTELTKKIYPDSFSEYEALIPQLPYIGGKANFLTTNLVRAGYALAFYRTLLKYGGTLEEASEFIHLAIKLKLESIPRFIRYWIGNKKYSGRNIQKMKQRARISQEKKYAEDWVWEVIDGDGHSFDVELNYTECGIQKFMRKQKAEELTPHLCNTDYVLFEACGLGLERTKNLAWGCDCCNFRIKRGKPNHAVFPPVFIERNCGEHKS